MSVAAPGVIPATGPAAELHAKLQNRTAVIGIVGLGYVGLPLARAVHKAGYPVLGYDVDPRKVSALTAGETYLDHLGPELTRELAASDRFEATADDARLAEADVILLCVPTPLGPHNEPDLSYVLDSTRMCARTLRPGQLIVLESTTYPGTTRDEMGPVLEATGLTMSTDFFLAYSPEREDPGRVGLSTETIPKLVGGVDPVSGELSRIFYESCIADIHFVETAEIAEAAKLLENIYRAVNIALVNELKVLLTDMDIDVWKVIEAAKTKPFGFQAFYPGPGLGGHCIPIDPFYLTWKAKEIGRTTKFIELAGEINRDMPRYVVGRLINALNDVGHSLKDAKVLVLGVAYKPDIDDMRESPAAEIIDLLEAGGAEVTYHDPHVPLFPRMRRHDIKLESVPLDQERLAAADVVLIVTDHRAVDYAFVGRHARLIVDSRNAMAAVPNPSATVVQA
jgi:UDP-N-acetyl-D-glucosamine dehydrogenase